MITGTNVSVTNTRAIRIHLQQYTVTSTVFQKMYFISCFIHKR